MPESKRLVKPVEINYICDKCENGILQQAGEMDKETGAIPHRCMICGAEHSFKWRAYPRIDFIGIDEDVH